MSRGADQPQSLADAWQGMRGDYAAAKDSRFRRRRVVPSLGAGADYHIRSDADYLRVMEYARDMCRNDAILGQAIDRAVTNIVQLGFTFDPQTGHRPLDELIRPEVHAWENDANAVDVAGVMTWPDFQEQAARSMLRDGDAFVLPVDGGRFEFVEAHRCRTPRNTTRNVVNGVLLDSNRRRLEYWFTADDIDAHVALNRVSDIVPIKAEIDGEPGVLHIHDRKRASQTRGITAIAPVFDLVGMAEDIQFAKTVQQQIVSCIAFLREQPIDAKLPGSPSPTGAIETGTHSDGSTRILKGIAPGIELTGRPGEKITGFSPNVPNAEYFQHMRLILSLIGVNIGLPLVMMLMDATETNFSGWRGAMNQAQQGFKRLQRILISRLHTPAARHVLLHLLATNDKIRAMAIDTGAVYENEDGRLVGSYFQHRWTTPRWPYVQPLQDIQADAMEVERRLTSPRRSAAKRGDDFDEVGREIIDDNANMITMAINKQKEIEQATGQRIDWHELLHLYMAPIAITAQREQLPLDEDGNEPSSQPGNKQPAAISGRLPDLPRHNGNGRH